MPSHSRNPSSEALTAADRLADARALCASAARIAGVVVYLAGTFAAAYAVLKLEVDGPARLTLIAGPVFASAIVGGFIARTLRAFDERERARAYQAMALGALGFAGMMMGAAMSAMTKAGPSVGLTALAFTALPLLLAWSMLTPVLLRVFRKPC